MAVRRFELSEGTSNKFWEIWTEGSTVHVKFGRVGTAGQIKTKDHGSAAGAAATASRLVLEKTKKGYAEIPAGVPAVQASEQGAAPVRVSSGKPMHEDTVDGAAEESEAVAACLKALDDIKEWLIDQGATAIVADLNDPITDEELKAAEVALAYPIPPELLAVYRVHNGQKNWDGDTNTFFRHGIGGFCDLRSAVERDDWRRFIGPWFQPGVDWDSAKHLSFTPLQRYPEQIVDRQWMQVDLSGTKSDLLPEECSTAWLVFGWGDIFVGVVHLRTGRVFRREKDLGLTFVADSFGAFLVEFANDLWNGKYSLERDSYDSEEAVEQRGWIWG